MTLREALIEADARVQADHGQRPVEVRPPEAFCTCGNPSSEVLTCYPPKCGDCRKFLRANE